MTDKARVNSRRTPRMIWLSCAATSTRYSGSSRGTCTSDPPTIAATVATMNRIPTARAVALCEDMTASAGRGRADRSPVAMIVLSFTTSRGQGISGAAERVACELLIKP